MVLQAPRAVAEHRGLSEDCSDKVHHKPGVAGLIVCVMTVLSAVTITGVSRPKDGGWSSRNPAS